MGNSFSNLQKLLVFVPSAKHDDFVRAHTGKGPSDKYYNKIVFLEKTKEIYTQGAYYGGSSDIQTDITNIKAILAGFGTLDGNDPRYPTVQDAINAVVQGINGSNIVNFSYASGNGYVIEDTISLTTTTNETGTWLQLGGGTSAYDIPLGQAIRIADSGGDIEFESYTYIATTSKAVREYVISKLGKIANALTFEGGWDKFEAELGLSNLTDDNRGDTFVNDKGENKTFTLNGETYTVEPGDLIIVNDIKSKKVNDVTIVERDLYGAVTASNTLENNQVVIGADGKRGVQTTGYILGADEDKILTSSGNKVLATEFAVANAINAGINALDTTYATANATYISYSYAQTDGLVTGITVGANIVSLEHAVGMQYNEATGQWEVAEGVVNHGLLDAADVAGEIIADEKVIAAALNDHESRIDALEEGGEVAPGSTKFVTGDTVYSYVGGAIDGLDVTETTVTASTVPFTTGDNNIQFKYKEEDGIVTISDLSYRSAYVAVIDSLVAELRQDGLVTGQLLADVINSLSPWEEYTYVAPAA